MNISVHIDAGSPDELAAIFGKLGSLGGAPAAAADTAFKPTDPAPEPPAAAPARRGRAPKAGAKPTDQTPQNTDAVAGGAAASSSTAEAKTDEPPAITADEVRSQIIDLLNDWSEAKPDDPEIRATILKPILDALGAAKIKEIDPAKYAMVPGLVDDSRKELDAYKGGSSGAEE